MEINLSTALPSEIKKFPQDVYESFGYLNKPKNVGHCNSRKYYQKTVESVENIEILLVTVMDLYEDGN